MFYGWKYEGKTDDGKHAVYFWNDGSITSSKFFDTMRAALDFVASWFNK